MYTEEGRKINRQRPLDDYPTPQFRRDSYLSLNGPWDFEINQSETDRSHYSKTILVPFAPETPLSGIESPIKKGDILHYRKLFSLPEGFAKGRVLLHFEAVDQVADVYLNKVKICHHEGGYLPFTVDCMELKEGENELLVEVQDDVNSDVFPRGKQAEKGHGIWYTPTSGIWGSVWLESVPNQVIQSIKLTPDFDAKKLQIRAQFEGKIVNCSVKATYNGKVVDTISLNENGEGVIDVSSCFVPWTPATPELYDLEVHINSDHVSSYFAMRKISVVEFNGFPRVALNDKPIFISGLLDQGYYPDGGLTPPSDEAMVRDIILAKELGFNCLRKHIKIEPMRWYYHCDRLGMLVMQDFVNGGSSYNPLLIALAPFFGFHFKDNVRYKRLGRANPESRAFFEKEMPEVVSRLYNCPCIFSYTLFNEGWGQFDSVRLTDKLKDLDPTRLIDSTSGWFDQKAGDFDSHHIYFRKVRMKSKDKRILALTEFGGYSLRIKGHCFSSRNFGYKRMFSQEELTRKMVRLYQKEILPCINKGLGIAILTQLTDVEEETNGLVTYDRKLVKVNIPDIKKANARLQYD